MHSDLPESLVRAYQETLFEVHLPGGRVVVSASGAPQGDRRALAQATLTVVTAYNPGTQRPTREENEGRQHRLEQYLRDRGWTAFPAEGYSPDRSHHEPSFAVLGLDREQARELGRLFGQAAVFFWGGATGEILWCQ